MGKVGVAMYVTSDLRYVGVEFSQGVAELLHVLSEELVGVGDAVVQVGHLVEGEATKSTQTQEEEWHV